VVKLRLLRLVHLLRFRLAILLLLVGQQFNLYQLQEKIHVALTQLGKLVGRQFTLIDQLGVLEVHQSLDFTLVVIEVAGDFVQRCTNLFHRHFTLRRHFLLDSMLLSSQLRLARVTLFRQGLLLATIRSRVLDVRIDVLINC